MMKTPSWGKHVGLRMKQGCLFIDQEQCNGGPPVSMPFRARLGWNLDCGFIDNAHHHRGIREDAADRDLKGDQRRVVMTNLESDRDEQWGMSEIVNKGKSDQPSEHIEELAGSHAVCSFGHV